MEELLNVRSAAWAEGLGAPTTVGSYGRLQEMKLQGLRALVTPMWGLDAGTKEPWTSETTRELRDAMKRAHARLAVVDLPVGILAPKDPGMHVQSRHTRHADLSSALPAHRRKQVRRALQAGLQFIQSADHVPQLVRLHQTARVRKSLPSDGIALERLLTRLASHAGFRQHFVADAAGHVCAGGAFIRTAPDQVLYAFGGAERSESSGLATVLLIAEAMRFAASEGVQWFDFGGSQDAGVDRFYAEFGGLKVEKSRLVVPASGWSWFWRWRRPDLFTEPA